MGFRLISGLRIDPAAGGMPDSLSDIYSYWNSRRGDRPMPARADIDPLDLRGRLGRIHLLRVESPRLFRYVVYGSLVTNPDARDMTGHTTGEYRDSAFGELVTRHLEQCVSERAPVCYDISAELDEQPYTYTRISLPLAGAAGDVEMILVGSHRGAVPFWVQRSL